MTPAVRPVSMMMQHFLCLRMPRAQRRHGGPRGAGLAPAGMSNFTFRRYTAGRMFWL